MAPLNMEFKLVTLVKSGTSMALPCKFIHPLKAPVIDSQTISPHCSMVSIFSRSPNPLKNILGKSPDILTVYIPGVVYVCMIVPVTLTSEVPSPQSTV